MTLHHKLASASGPSWADCHYLLHRWDARTAPSADAWESFVVAHVGGVLHLQMQMRGRLSGLWRAPDGEVFVADARGAVHHFRDGCAPGARWETHRLGGVVRGVWGTREDDVWAWSMVPGGARLHRWDGAQWREVAAPGVVAAMHGVAPDLVYAVGAEGLVAAWDGDRWRRVGAPTDRPLSSVFVADAREMYAVGPGGDLLEGSVHGWIGRASFEGPLQSVAVWRGGVLVGAGAAGLMRLDGTELAPWKPAVEAEHFDARGALLVTTPGAVVETLDGRSYRGTPLDEVVAAVAAVTPAWQTG